MIHEITDKMTSQKHENSSFSTYKMYLIAFGFGYGSEPIIRIQTQQNDSDPFGSGIGCTTPLVVTCGNSEKLSRFVSLIRQFSYFSLAVRYGTG